MRNIERHRNIAAAITLAGVSGLASCIALGVSPDRAAMFGAGIVSFLVALIAGFFASTLQYAAHRRKRLLRGERLLAAWSVSVDT
ncbi:MAG: hypothetical protein MUF00_10870 [Gemmatimonadaceae bacterium]|jgi:hypothetical protein|nr:hypothetical protein [Gemmatimonadaceae bacterium]